MDELHPAFLLRSSEASSKLTKTRDVTYPHHLAFPDHPKMGHHLNLPLLNTVPR